METAVKNLYKEGLKNNIYQTGDVMYDTLIHNIKIAEKSKILEKFGIKSKKYFLATIHRQSNTDNMKNLTCILKAFSDIGEKIIFPVHPRTEKFLRSYKLKDKITNVHESKVQLKEEEQNQFNSKEDEEKILKRLRELGYIE